MSAARALEGYGEHNTAKLLEHWKYLELNHFEKAPKSKENDGEFIVSTCKECKPSEKPLIPQPTTETGNTLRDFKELIQFYSALTKEYVKHMHIPNEKEKENVGFTFSTDYFLLPPIFGEYFSEEKNRSIILESEFEPESESEFGSESGLEESESGLEESEPGPDSDYKMYRDMLEAIWC